MYLVQNSKTLKHKALMGTLTGLTQKPSAIKHVQFK